MKLAQALGGGQASRASRIVGAQRIVVELGMQKLRVVVQDRRGRRWVLPQQESCVRYLNGVLRDRDGSWIVACNNLAALDSVALCLPPAYQHLLAPGSDDWQTLKTEQPDALLQEHNHSSSPGLLHWP